VRQLIYFLPITGLKKFQETRVLSDSSTCLPLVGNLGSCGRSRSLVQLLQLVVEPQGELHVGRPLASWHLMLLGRLDAHLDQLLERLREAHSTEQAGLEGPTAQEDVLAEYLEVVVLLDVRAGLLLLVAHPSAGVEVAVLVGVALDAPGQSLVQLALHVDMLRALVL